LTKARQALREGAPEIFKKMKEGQIIVTTDYLPRYLGAKTTSSGSDGVDRLSYSSNYQGAPYTANVGAQEMARITHEKNLHERLRAQIAVGGPAEDQEIKNFIEDLDDIDNIDEDQLDVDNIDEDQLEDFSSGPSDNDEDDQIEDLPMIGVPTQEIPPTNQEDPETNTFRASFGSLRLSNVFPENSMGFRTSMSLCSSFLSSATSLMRQSLLSIDSGLRSSLESRRSDATIHPASSGDCTENNETCEPQVVKITNIDSNFQATHSKQDAFPLQGSEPNTIPDANQSSGNDTQFEPRTSIATSPEENDFRNGNRNLGGNFYTAGVTMHPPQYIKQHSEPFLMRSSLNAPTYHLQNIQESYAQQPQAQFNPRGSLVERPTFDSSNSAEHMLRASSATNATAPARLRTSLFVGSMYADTPNSSYSGQDNEY